MHCPNLLLDQRLKIKKQTGKWFFSFKKNKSKLPHHLMPTGEQKIKYVDLLVYKNPFLSWHRCSPVIHLKLQVWNDRWAWGDGAKFVANVMLGKYPQYRGQWWYFHWTWTHKEIHLKKEVKSIKQTIYLPKQKFTGQNQQAG